MMKLLLTLVMTMLLALPLTASASVTVGGPGLEPQAAQLNADGLEGQVIASSPFTADGFLALLRKPDGGFTFAFYNDFNGVSGYARYDAAHYDGQHPSNALAWVGRDKAPEDDGLAVFWLEIPNDQRNEDGKLGVWRGNTHVIPLYALYLVEGGRVTRIERAFSASDQENPGHYHDNVQEARTIQMATTVLKCAKALGDDMEARGLDPRDLSVANAAAGSAADMGARPAGDAFVVTIYTDPATPEYKGLGRATVLAPYDGDYGMAGTQPMRFVSNQDEVRVGVYYGHVDTNTYQFVADREIMSAITEAGKVYEFRAFMGEGMPYYRVVAEKGGNVETWDVMPDMRDGNTVFVLDTSAPKG